MTAAVVDDLRAAVAALEAENAQLRALLAHVREQSSAGYARGSIKNANVAPRGESA